MTEDFKSLLIGMSAPFYKGRIGKENLTQNTLYVNLIADVRGGPLTIKQKEISETRKGTE